MAENYVAPSQERKFSAKGEFLGFYNPPRYRVDVPDLPNLVARDIMPFKFLKMREDFPTRFKGCNNPDDVRAVLVAEEYYEN